MRISDWSSDVCSSDLGGEQPRVGAEGEQLGRPRAVRGGQGFLRFGGVRQAVHLYQPPALGRELDAVQHAVFLGVAGARQQLGCRHARLVRQPGRGQLRSEEHTSELQSLMRISYAVFCLNKKPNTLSKMT